MSDDPNQTSPNEADEIALRRKALRKLGLRLRKASEKYLAAVGRRDDVILKQIDFTIADCQQLVAALCYESSYFIELAYLFGKTQGEDTNPDMVAAQRLGIQEGLKAANEFFKGANPVKAPDERPA